VLRNCDGKKRYRGTRAAARQLETEGDAHRRDPFVLARIVLQDFTGVPLLCDLAAMRNVAQRWARIPR